MHNGSHIWNWAADVHSLHPGGQTAFHSIKRPWGSSAHRWLSRHGNNVCLLRYASNLFSLSLLSCPWNLLTESIWCSYFFNRIKLSELASCVTHLNAIYLPCHFRGRNHMQQGNNRSWIPDEALIGWARMTYTKIKQFIGQNDVSIAMRFLVHVSSWTNQDHDHLYEFY